MHAWKMNVSLKLNERQGGFKEQSAYAILLISYPPPPENKTMKSRKSRKE